MINIEEKSPKRLEIQETKTRNIKKKELEPITKKLEKNEEEMKQVKRLLNFNITKKSGHINHKKFEYIKPYKFSKTKQIFLKLH